jgi:hypothetical protein
MNNPFAFGHALQPNQLVGRTQEVRTVAAAIRDHGKLFLIGPRRFGKTSILRAAEAQAEGEGAIVLRYDVEAYPGLDALVRAIVAGAAKRLTGPASKIAKTVRTVFARLRPEVSFDAVQQSWHASLGVVSEASTTSAPVLLDALEGLAGLADVVEQPVALVLDEFQRIIDLGGESIERQFRALIQQQAHVGYVFAGSRTALLNDMTLNPARPFYRLGARLFVRTIPRKEFIPFIQAGFNDAGVRVPMTSANRLCDLAQDVPYNVQALAHEAWALVCEENRRQLTVRMVESALSRLVERDHPFYAQVWNQLTLVQQRSLLAAVREGGQSLFMRTVTQRYHIAANAMRQALFALEARDILRREDEVGETHWRLEDPFFAVWLERVSMP